MEKKATKIVDLLVEDVRFPTSLELGQQLVLFPVSQTLKL